MLREQSAGSASLRADALAGLAAFQRAPRASPPPAPPVLARIGNARLLDYGGTGPALVAVPSLINPAAILDLTAESSLMRWLATQGVRPLLVDWGAADDPTLTVAGHVERRLLPLLDALGERALLLGYCLGGTMAMAAAAVRPPLGLALVAAPWRFAGYGAERDAIGAMWAAARPAAERLGLLPMEVLQAGFWRLDPARTVAKYARLARLDPASAEARLFVALEDWVNAGEALPLGAARELFDDLVGRDLPGRRRWRVAGRAVVPRRIDAPVLNIVSRADRIVPAATAARAGRRLTLGLGHVGMVVGGGARAAVWAPLAAFLSAAARPR